MKQISNGIIATSAIVAVSLGIISLFNNDFFSTWLSFGFMACIPSQVVCGLVWQTEYPSKLAKLRQPIKGMAFTGLSVLGGLIFGPLMWLTIGGGESPTPQLMMFTIFTIISTFWVVGIWQCWPISAVSQHPLFIGIGVLILSYGGAYVLFNLLFDFSFLAGAPIYIEALDPKGVFMAWQVLAFCVTTVAVIMFCILCDFWPVSSLPLAQNHSGVFGLMTSLWVLLLSSIIFYIAITQLHLDYVVYMVRGPVSFIFGAFICLNMMQNTLFSSIKQQPLRGLVLALSCIALAALMQTIYQAASNIITPNLGSGLPAYELELWLANAMLAVTFPLIVAHSDFFKLWPLRNSAQDNELSETTNHG